MALKPCAQPGCPVLLPRGGSRCPKHAKEQRREIDQRRGSAAERGYDAAWARFSKQWRANFPICGMRADGRLHADHSRCVQLGMTTTAKLAVDHIIPMESGGDKYAQSNLQTLCLRCNAAKAGALNAKPGGGSRYGA